MPSLYVHIPFCRSRCNYCAFASGIYRPGLADAYLDALAGELARRNIFSPSAPPDSIYLGGGTPSALSIRQLERLLSLLPEMPREHEFTCEINPDSADPEKLRLLRERGANRCSLGVQTFDPSGLAWLGRRHGAAAARRAAELATEGGFPSVSLDLLHAWPGQELSAYLKDLREAVGLGIGHLSCYHLSLEPGTRLAEVPPAQKLAEKSEEESLAFWREGEALLRESGFVHYETSNFARPGRECRHNAAIWKGGEYLGLGAAAHSHLAGRRMANVAGTAAYIERLAKGDDPVDFSERLPPLAKARECAVFWLRLFDGVDLGEFLGRTGFDFRQLYAGVLPGMLEKGYLRFDPAGGKIRVPADYQPVLDAILPDLL
ncbi:MAG: radical SAM family heme chaperone HemW [Planctomycetota bacterium]|jgi:oxygen-independent coproporphyrinogen-3 oxidase|nr:radical SAM family heme chaperone HemW [Planctomycetota bacterium]